MYGKQVMQALSRKKHKTGKKMKKKKKDISQINNSIFFKILSFIVAYKSEKKIIEKLQSLLFNFTFNRIESKYQINKYTKLAEKISYQRSIGFSASYCRILKLRKMDKKDHFLGKDSLIEIKESGLLEVLSEEELPDPDDIIFIENNKNIIADYNVYFGVMVIFTNWTGDIKSFEYRLIHPPLNDPEPKIKNDSMEIIKMPPGSIQKCFYYYFLEEWEMVEGSWIFSFTDSNGDEVKQEFKVRRMEK